MSSFEEGFDSGFIEGFQQASDELLDSDYKKCDICGRVFFSPVVGVRICEHCREMGYD